MTTKEYIDWLLANDKYPASTFQIDFNPEKHVLGVLCKRGHEYANTGLSVRGKTHRDCFICLRLNSFAWLRKYPDRAAQTRRNAERHPDRRAKRRAARKRWAARGLNCLSTSVWGAQKRKGIECDIDVPFMLDVWHRQGGLCHWLNIPMRLDGPPRHPLKPSIDRLDPTKGYVKDNVVWATNFANRAKSDTPPDEFRDILTMVVAAMS